MKAFSFVWPEGVVDHHTARAAVAMKGDVVGLFCFPGGEQTKEAWEASIDEADRQFDRWCLVNKDCTLVSISKKNRG